MGSEKAGIFSSAAAAVRKRFFDNFNRADQSGLGTATDGSLWRQIRGSFSISGNKAVGADNNYPMAVVDMPFSNVEIDIAGATQGAAAALWVTDSGNWWAVGIDQTSVTSCQTCNDPIAWASSNCNGTFNSVTWNCASSVPTCAGTWNANTGSTTNSWNPFQWTTNSWNPIQTNPCQAWNTAFSFCAAFGPGNCRAWRSTAPRNCTAFNAPVCNSTGFTPATCRTPGNTFGGNPQTSFAFQFGGNPQTSFAFQFGSFCNAPSSTCVAPGNPNTVFCNGNFNPQNPIAWNTYSCNCVTTYPQYIRIMKSVASVVSEVWSTTVASVVQSFSVRTNGSQITVKAYSDPNLVTQIGSDIVHTPTGVTVVSTYGITIDPSSYNQGYSIDQVEIIKN